LFRSNHKHKQEAFEKCWAHRHCEPPHAHSPGVASGTVARRLRIDVHDNDNRVTEGTAMAPWNGPNDDDNNNSSAKGGRDLISKNVHYQLVRGNSYNFLLLYSVIYLTRQEFSTGAKSNNNT